LIKVLCHGCEHLQQERYRVQGDSGHDVSCGHPAVAGREIGDSKWDTPAWCPLRAEAVAQFVNSEGGK
jgi:hypothetical protein